DGINLRYARSLPFIDDHRPGLVDPNTDLCEPHPLGVGLAPSGIHDEFGFNFVPAGGAGDIAASSLVDPRHLGPAANVDAASAHLFSQCHANIVIEPEEQFRTPDQLHDFAAETAEDAGELDRDIAAADDDDMAR